ncbi:hypothetical protein M1615_02580 [Patescibacteria group bacterium]|nr:hypothetical protein [Patescibacteria group bacterium]
MNGLPEQNNTQDTANLNQGFNQPQDVSTAKYSQVYNSSFPSPAGNAKEKLKGLALFKIGFMEIFFVVLVLLIFFGILNFFNILSLSELYPSQLGWLPHLPTTSTQNISNNNNLDNLEKPVYNHINNTWYVKGIFLQYNNNILKVKSGNQVYNFIFSYQNSTFYKQIINPNASPSTKVQNIVYTLYDLDQQQNLGKNVQVTYTQDKSGTNTIQSITLLN